MKPSLPASGRQGVAEIQPGSSEDKGPAFPSNQEDLHLAPVPVDVRGGLRALLGSLHHPDWNTNLPQQYPALFTVFRESFC